MVLLLCTAGLAVSVALDATVGTAEACPLAVARERLVVVVAVRVNLLKDKGRACQG